jgi:hypothetical protein
MSASGRFLGTTASLEAAKVTLWGEKSLYQSVWRRQGLRRFLHPLFGSSDASGLRKNASLDNSRAYTPASVVKQARKGVCVSANLQAKPLCRLQEFLKELKTTISLLTKVLVEIKNLLVIGTLILFFILGVWHALNRIASNDTPASVGSQRPP